VFGRSNDPRRISPCDFIVIFAGRPYRVRKPLIAAAAATTTTMLINSFPHPAVTGSDLAATLTENKTINVTCRPESASVHTHTHTRARRNYTRRYILLLYVYNRYSPRIDLYNNNIIYRCIIRPRSRYRSVTMTTNRIYTHVHCTRGRRRRRRRRRDKPHRYYIIIFRA